MRIIIFIFPIFILLPFNLKAQTFISATGGTVTTDGDYKVHTFISSGTFTVTGGSGNVQLLVVAGGGSGGGSTAGGGGGGGLVYNAGYAITIQDYIVTVGAGGATTAPQVAGNNGQNSVFGMATAIGGGGGGFTHSNGGGAGLNGGSGGGAGAYPGIGAFASGSGTSEQGNNGGSINTENLPGGGGGAGAVGSNAISGQSGNGGVGLAYLISGSIVYYAGGGGGGAYGIGGSGGNGGGGAGTSNGTPGVAGVPNTGGGGGGGWGHWDGVGGAGGSGIVIVRYQFQGTGGTGGSGNGGTTSTTASQWITSGSNIYYNSGNVSIGTIDPKGYRFAVNGDAIFTRIKVKSNAIWPDYVFHKDYKLPPLEEIGNYIKINKHLPGIPSATEIEKNGIDVGDNQAALLKKIEELTLYIIQQEKRITSLEKKSRKN